MKGNIRFTSWETSLWLFWKYNVGKKYNEGQHCPGQTKYMNSPLNMWSTVVTLPSSNGHTKASTKTFGCILTKGMGWRAQSSGLQALSMHQSEQLSFYLVHLWGYHVITYVRNPILPAQINVWKVLTHKCGLENTSKANIQANSTLTMDCCFWGVALDWLGTSEEKRQSAADNTPGIRQEQSQDMGLWWNNIPALGVITSQQVLNSGFRNIGEQKAQALECTF